MPWIFPHRVVIQNERYDSWKNTLVRLKKMFVSYEQKVLREEQRAHDLSIPKAFNSSAAQGNFLEVLNLSLNGKLRSVHPRPGLVYYGRLRRHAIVVWAPAHEYSDQGRACSFTSLFHTTFDNLC